MLGGDPRRWWSWLMISTHASILVDSVGPPSTGVCRTTTKVDVKDIPLNPAITIQEVSCIPNTPNTLVRCIGALVQRRDSEIQVILMIMSGNCNLK
jgi:hypothetical protein